MGLDHLSLEPPIQIRELHWSLWAERERGDAIAGPRLARLELTRGPRELATLRQLFELSEHDDDVAEALGLGVRVLAIRDPRAAAAVRSRYVAWSDHVAMAHLARRWGISRARVSQIADDGMRRVEAWVHSEVEG